MLSSIRSKILIFAVLATLIPSLGLGLLSFWQNELLIGDNVSRELRALASYSSRELDLWIEKSIHDTRVLSTSNPVIDGLSGVVRPRAGNEVVNPQALAHYLRSVQEKLDTLLELTVLDADGHVLASSAAAPTVVALPQSWLQTVHTEGVVIAPPHWDSGRAVAVFSVAVPVLSIDNEQLGVLVAVLDLRTVLPHLKSTGKSPPGEVMLLDPEGRVLLSSYAAARDLPPLNAALLQRLRAQPGQPVQYLDAARHPVIGVADVSTALPVTVVAERDRAEIYSGWVRLRNLFLMLVSGLTLTVALVAYRLGRTITLPLQRLMGAADRITAGDLDVQLSVSRNDELGRLTQVFNQMADKLRRIHAEVEVASRTLLEQNELLAALSVTDSLTGLYNRSKLDAILEDQVERYHRDARPFALMMLDIDHFKTLNDTSGHLAGDEVLAAVAKILRQSIRNVDYAARYGGDEFAVVLIDTPAAVAWETAERIRAQVEHAHYAAGDQRVTITLSVGIAEWQDDDVAPATVIKRADQALYAAKRDGRNLVRSAL